MIKKVFSLEEFIKDMFGVTDRGKLERLKLVFEESKDYTAEINGLTFEEIIKERPYLQWLKVCPNWFIIVSDIKELDSSKCYGLKCSRCPFRDIQGFNININCTSIKEYLKNDIFSAFTLFKDLEPKDDAPQEIKELINFIKGLKIAEK